MYINHNESGKYLRGNVLALTINSIPNTTILVYVFNQWYWCLPQSQINRHINRPPLFQGRSCCGVHYIDRFLGLLHFTRKHFRHL